MADLKTNYKDDVLDTSKNEKRKFRMIQNDDGTVSFDDATEYTQQGDAFGAADINATNAKINEQNQSLTQLNEGIEWKRNDDILQRSDNDSIYIKYTKFIYNKANAEATMKVASLRGIPEGSEIKIGNISDSQFYPKILAKDISYSDTSIAAIYIDNEGTIKYRQIKDNMPENYDVIVSIRWSLF